MHIKSMSVMTSALLVAQLALANVWINEVQSSNDSTCVDENGESPDWIELYNDGAEDVDLSGWGLSDKATKPFKWTFPQGTVIKAGDYLQVYADTTEEESLKSVEPIPVEPENSSAYGDLVCWLRADDALSASGEGGGVDVWTDRSSFGNNASNCVESARPTVVADAVNGHAALQFSAASSQYLNLPVASFNGMDSFSNATVMIVQRWNGTKPGNSTSGFLGLATHEGEVALRFEYYGAGYLKLYNGLAGAQAEFRDAQRSGKEAWRVSSFMSDSAREVSAVSSLAQERNKVAIATKAFTAPAFADLTDDGRLTIGNALPYERAFFDGSIAEILIFRRALSKAEFDGVSKYLEDRYAVVPEKRLHASFSLSASGESLLLTAFGATEPADSISFGSIPCDKSYGRLADGSHGFFAKATPLAKNSSTAYSAPLSEVVFSEERGVKSEPFDLTLSHDDPDAVIIYTLDHSLPTAEHGTVYHEGDVIRITHTTIVRAIAIKDGALDSQNSTTHSYVFLGDVFSQRAFEGAAEDWTYNNASTPASYSLSENVICDSTSSNGFLAAMNAVPIVSITLPNENLFGAETGLYGGGGAKSEFEASVEWVSGEAVFGVRAGLLISGNTSRAFTRTPKKSFRLAFRGRYGYGKLEQPVLKDGGYDCAEFNTLILRGENNQSWAARDNNGGYGTSMRDQFVRDLQGSVSGFQSAGAHVHLFLNGLYWGLYNVSERPDADSGALRFGGDSRAYACCKNSGPTGFETRDGDGVAYQSDLLDVFATDPSSPDGWADVAAKYDIKSFAEYMLVQYFVGNGDWPNNNWVVLGAPTTGVPYRWFVWDAEGVMLSLKSNATETKPGSLWTPQKLERFLEQSGEYRLLFADCIHKHCYNGGILTEDSLKERYAKLGVRVRAAVFAEAARWGAYQHDYVTPSTQIFGMDEWDAEYERLMGTYFPGRKEVVMAQFRKLGLYPDVDAPEFAAGASKKEVTIVAPDGASVYYTTDGSDPRVAFEGSVSLSAREYKAGEVITSSDSERVFARARLDDGTWSAISETTIEVSSPQPVKNVFLLSTNGQNWDKDANWSFGYYPNGPGATAVIGVPTDFKQDKGWRNIHINKNDVTVGHVEMTNGGCTNRIDTGKSGNLIFCGDTNEVGEVVNSASFVVTDTGDSGLAMIDLDDPNVVSLASDVEFCISNVIGDVEYGGMLCKGKWAGNGHNLLKSGPGRMTIDFSCADGYPAFGKLQVAEGVLAILKPVRAESITKEGECWVKGFAETLDEVTNVAVVCSEKVSVDNPCLFVPTFNGGKTFYGGFVAPDLKKASKCKVYVRDDSGTVRFAGGNWTKYSLAKVSTVQLADGLLTYSVTLPKLVEDPPEFVPSQDPSIVVSAESKADAILKVVLVAPSGEDGLPVVDSDSYTAYFKLSAASGGTTGSFVVTAELDKAVIAADDSVYDVAEALKSLSSVDVGDTLEATVAAKPGLYYSVLSSADLNAAFTEGARTLATGSTVQLRVPCVDSKTGFYKIKISVSGK